MDKIFTETNWVLPLLIIFASLLFIRAFNTLVHEVGHAIAIALLTKDKVTIFLGSYGDKEKSKKITIGKFEIWIRLNLFKWKGGLCVPHAANISPRSVFIFTLAGPLATLCLSLTVLTIFLVTKPVGLPAAFLFICCVITGLSFLYNIVPRSAAIFTANGNMTYNDGTKLKMLLDFKKLPPEYELAVAHINEKRFADAVPILESIIGSGTKNPDIYRMAILANMELRNYTKADRLQKQQIAVIGNLNTHDRVTLALLKTFLGKYDEAIAYYKHLLRSDPLNKFNLNNLGYTYSLTGDYEEAIVCLDKAISVDGAFANAFSTRAYVKIKMRLLEDGKADNDTALQLNEHDACAYRNAGLYYYERENYAMALQQFEKTLTLDPGMPDLNGYLFDIKRRLEDNETEE